MNPKMFIIVHPPTYTQKMRRHFRSYRFCDDVQGWDEELVTDEGEGVEHVDDADDVKDDGAVLQLLVGKQVRRKKRIVFRTKQKKIRQEVSTLRNVGLSTRIISTLKRTI
jgi:hypothetical protein